jgi:trans-2,3-dihydro-3-hydroxyanthranilate isomerase
MAAIARTVPHSVKVYQVDAFTDAAFGGNPAGVVPDAAGRADLRVRFFTPQAEVELCGHATIGTFWLLAELGVINERGWGRELPGTADWRELELIQETGAGSLTVILRYGRVSGTVDRVLMAQAPPSRLARLGETERRELASILRVKPAQICVIRMVGDVPAEVWSTGLPDLILPVLDMATLRSLAPDHGRLAEMSRRLGVISVHAFCLETESVKSDAHARDFSPAVGIPEEAATGTASGAMGAHIVANRLGPANRTGHGPYFMSFEQGHILARPSTIHVEVDGEAGHPSAVRVGGRAVTVLEGVLRF